MPPRRRKNSDDESADEGSGSDSDAFVPHNYVKNSASPANEKPARARRAVKSYKETAHSDGEVASSARSSGGDDGESGGGGGGGSGDDHAEEVGPSVELFVARRGSASQDVDARAGPFEYLVKWRKLSYKHVTWQTEDELLELPGAMKTRLTRFNAKWDQRIRDHECALCPRLA